MMDELFQYAVAIRRALHEYPEVGFDLERTVRSGAAVETAYDDEDEEWDGVLEDVLYLTLPSLTGILGFLGLGLLGFSKMDLK